MSATFFADLAGFALAEEAFALVFDALGFAVDADRPDFFPLALGFSRALVAIVLSPPDFVWRKDKGTSALLHYRAHGCVVSSLNPHLSL